MCLCWKLDEKDVAFWHETDAGFAGRQKIREQGFGTKDQKMELLN